MHTLTEAYEMSNTELREALEAARAALNLAAGALSLAATRLDQITVRYGDDARSGAAEAARIAVLVADVLDG